MDYPVSPTLRSAIQQLFEDEHVAYTMLGQLSPLSEREIECPPDADASQRARALCKKLESYIELKAEELDELPDDHLRLRSEAVGLLLALREIQTHFPDAIW